MDFSYSSKPKNCKKHGPLNQKSEEITDFWLASPLNLMFCNQEPNTALAKMISRAYLLICGL